MEKIIKTMKGKKVLSFVLAAIMLVTTFSVAVPVLKLDTNAAEMTYDSEGNIIIDGVTQKQIVTKNNATAILNTQKYDEYAANYLGGAGYSTGIVIPGLNATHKDKTVNVTDKGDYVIQGMTYYPARDWFLVTAYHSDAEKVTENTLDVASRVFALDASTGKFVAMFSFLDPDGVTYNKDHGGGITISEHNLYYSCGDKDRCIAYAPLFELEKAPIGEHTVIKLVAEKDFVEIGSVADGDKTAYSAYVCYDQGILWMGNFYDQGADLGGITIAAADYNCRSNNTYNSMVFGYRLSGSTSEEEWANLTGSNGKDCQGSPSYALGLNNALKDVQYATVYNGKLYLSRSYGSGAGNSLTFGFGETSFLTVADIDLSQPGDTPVKISTTATGSLNKTINAYNIEKYTDYSMMPMSEGICMVDDQMFITFEGASNKYLNESGGTLPLSFGITNCEKPVDVIWQLDPYELLGIPDREDDTSLHYEKVNSLSEIVSGEEYIIVHESTEKDPVTQNNILYAMDAYGNFNGHKLSKTTGTTVKGYNGMIGHSITDYDITEYGDLYLNNPEKDDLENIRWTLTNVSGENYKITSSTKYFANCKNLYFDADQITMMYSTSEKLDNIKITQSIQGNGKFYFNNNSADGQFLLWCNEGTKATYNTAFNSYYSDNADTNTIYSGITEQKGTFHCDALNVSQNNVINAQIPADDGAYSEGAFQIYKRVVDDVASTYESRVFTDLNAEVQADGTYTIDLETYAISPNHYRYVGKKPTDYIIVADTSDSMKTEGSTGIAQYPGNLGVASMCIEEQLANDIGKPEDKDYSGDRSVVIGHAFSYEDLYYKHTDGKFYKLYMGLRNVFKVSSFIAKWWSFKQQYFYLYYVADDGYYYCFTNQESTPSKKYTDEQFKAWVAGTNGVLQTASSTKDGKGDRIKEKLNDAVHYRFDNVNSPSTKAHTRIKTLKEAASNLVDKIAAENSNNRIALVQFGADTSTGYYNTNGTLSKSGYTDAFWQPSQKDTLKSKISELSTSVQTDNSGKVFEHVNSIMTNSGRDYKGGDSKYNAVIIYLSDGVVGADDQANFKTAANNNIAKALTAKQNGAFIYTIMIGADGTKYDRNLYMELLSSKYAEASGINDPSNPTEDKQGGQSVDGINYVLSLATTNMYDFIDYGGVVLKETSKNNAVGIDSLNKSAFIRQELNECFNYDNADCSAQLITGRFDAIGRFKFDKEGVPAEENGVTVNFVDGKRHLTITGYNYADEYVGKGKDGRMLRVRITGLLPKDNAVIQHEPISNLDTTAVYKSKDDMNASTAQKDLSFKKLPTEYANINKYTYVLDYGLQMLDTDVNGTLCAVSNSFSVQDAENNYANAKTALDGDIAIQSGDQNLLYSMSPDVGTTNHIGYTLIKRPEGNYEWFKIKLVPASNVLFEENVLTAAGKSDNKWSPVGTALENTYQSLSGKDDRYGYDEAYANNGAGYSNGTAYKSTVNSTTKRSETMKFSYTGTGFDLMAACGASTGIEIIKVMKVEDGAKKAVKAMIVDTYYNGEYNEGENSKYADTDGLLKQVPVARYEGEYGTYEVEVTAAYLSSAQGVTGPRSVSANPLLGGVLNAFSGKAEGYSIDSILDELDIDIPADEVELIWFDDNSVLNGGTGPASAGSKARSTSTAATNVELACYIDSVRVYNPLGDDTTNYIASEKGAQYYNIIDELADTENGALTSTDSLFAYVTGALDPNKNGTILSFENYQAVGPQHEVYLEKATDGEGSHAVSFNVTVPDSSSRVMISLRAVNGATTAKIASGKSYQFDINTATEQYFDITPYLDTNDDGVATITVTNVGDGLLSVNNLKVVGGGLMPLSDEDLPVMARALATEPITIVPNAYDYDAPVVNEDVQEPETDAPAEDDTPEADEPVTDVPMDVVSIIKMLLKFIETIILKFF